MSASRKKQERKLAEAPELSAREQEELVKAAQRKRNTVVYSIIGVVVVILAAILLIWDSGVFQRNATVATIGGEKVTPAEVSFHYHNNELANIASYYSQYGFATPYSPSVSAREQVIDEQDITEWGVYGLSLDKSYVGKTYHEYFLDSALNILRKEYALVAAAKEAGYTLSETGKANVEAELETIDNTLESYLAYGYNFNRKTYLQQLYGSTMTERTFRSCMERSELASEYYNVGFMDMANYSEAELEAFYQENKDVMDTVVYYFRHFDATLEEATDAEGNTITPSDEKQAEALEQALADANAEAEKVQGNLDAVVDNEDYTIQVQMPQPGDFHYDWIMDADRQQGDSKVFEITNGYYVVVFDERYRDETPTVNVRHILVEAKNADDPATTDVNESTKAPTDEVFAAAEKKAQELLDQWKANGGTEEAFAKMAEEYSADAGSNTNGGLYERVAEGRMTETFNDWCFDESRQSGDTGIVKNTMSYTQGWHIIYFVGHDEPVWVSTARDGKWSADLTDTVEIVRTEKLDSAIG